MIVKNKEGENLVLKDKIYDISFCYNLDRLNTLESERIGILVE